MIFYKNCRTTTAPAMVINAKLANSMHSYKSKLITIRNEANTATIDIDGVIGEDWFSEGNTVETVKADIEAVAGIKADKIVVNINSLGGDYFHGIGIHNVLANNPARVEVNITGWTASAGTLIAMAGDTIKAASNIGFLIHNAWTFTVGNKVELQSLIEELGVIDNNQARMYSKRTGMSVEEVQALMDENDGNGKWLTAEEAMELGFIDEVYETVKAAAFNKANAVQALTKMQSNKTENMNLIERFNALEDKILAMLKPQTEVEEQSEETTEEEVVTEEAITEERVEQFEAKVTGLEEVINDYKAQAETAKSEAEANAAKVADLEAKVTELESKLASGIDTEGEGGKGEADANMATANALANRIWKKR